MSAGKVIANASKTVAAKLKTDAPYGMKFGPGGRSSNNGMTATVFGSTGFVGRYLMNELGACGTRVYAPYRGCELEMRSIKQMFDLGQVGFVPFSPRDRQSMMDSMRHSDVVINLIGKHYETKHLVPTRRADGSLSRINYDFEDVHVRIPETIAELAAEAGVKTLIHVSALAADENSKSRWNQTKARGEVAVRSKFPDAIIVKPATIFGAEDRFLNFIAETCTRVPVFPILNHGQALVQPVHAVDVAQAIMQIIYGEHEFKGRTFQLVGPAEYSYKELVEFVADITMLPTTLVDVPVSSAMMLGKVTEQLINPWLSQDMVQQMLEDVVAKDDPSLLTFADLEMTPSSVDRMAFDYLSRFRRGGHFRLVQGYH